MKADSQIWAKDGGGNKMKLTCKTPQALWEVIEAYKGNIKITLVSYDEGTNLKEVELIAGTELTQENKELKVKIDLRKPLKIKRRKTK
jgi:hypothetical protein